MWNFSFTCTVEKKYWVLKSWVTLTLTLTLYYQQPQRTQISSIINYPFMQNSNLMASSDDCNRKFSEHIFSTFVAIFKSMPLEVFWLTGLLWWQKLDISSIFCKRLRFVDFQLLFLFLPKLAKPCFKFC